MEEDAAPLASGRAAAAGYGREVAPAQVLQNIALEIVRAMLEKSAAMAGEKHQQRMKPLRIDCAEENWKVLLKRNLQDGIEVDLDNLDYGVDGVLCEILAMAHSMTLRYNSRTKSWLFKKPSAPLRVV